MTITLHRSRPRPTDRIRTAWLAERGSKSAVLVLSVAFAATPVVYVFSKALVDDAAGVRRLVDDPYFWDALRVTLTLAVGSTLFALALGTALAWWAHVLPRKRRWLGALPLLPLVAPSLALLLGYIFLLNPNIGYLNAGLRSLPGLGASSGPFDVYTVPWMIVVTGLSLSAFVYLFVRSALSQFPRDLVESAATSGASPRWVFWRVIFPLLRPALVYGSMTVGVLSLGQFAAPLFLGRQGGIHVLSTEVFFHSTTYPPDRALASAYGLPIVAAGVLFLGFQRFLLRDQDKYVTTSTRGARPLESHRLLPQVALVVYGVVTIGLPLLALAVVSAQPFWSKDIVLSDLTLDNYFELFRRDDLVSAIWNSIYYSLAASAITLVLAHLVAGTLYRRRRTPVIALVQDVGVSLPLGVPAVILGVGFLLFYTESPLPLYGKPLGLIVMYVVIMMPFATRLQLSARTALGEDLLNAAAASGASPLRRTLLVQLPLLRPAFAASAALVVVLVSHEFSASALVRSRKTMMMGPIIYDLWSYGSYPLSAAMALLMCVVTGTGIAIALALGGFGRLMDMEGENV